MKYAIRIEGLSKKYLIFHQEQLRKELREQIIFNIKSLGIKLKNFLLGTHSNRPNYEEFLALNNVSFDVMPGERIGIVGRNGAGKSTLLKVLSRITEPTSGRVLINGRVASLLEVGTGFHPELTGRENIYLNGAILGMSRAEIARKFDSIVDFAGVDRFLDTPVKRYSSGMYVRLAFSVAAHLDSDILIVDEVLAVGDAGFQKKCMSKMESVAKEGRTIIFVSHNMGAISELCTKAVLMHKGELIMVGNVSEIIERYARLNMGNKATSIKMEPNLSELGSIRSVRMLNAKGMEVNSFDLAEEISVEIVYSLQQEFLDLQVTINLARNMMDIIHSYDTDDDQELPLRPKGIYKAIYKIPGMHLKGGKYNLSINLGTPTKLIHNLECVLTFDIEELSINTNYKGYRHDRPGQMISPGTWTTRKIS